MDNKDLFIAYSHTALNYIIKMSHISKLIDYNMPKKEIEPSLTVLPVIKLQYINEITNKANSFLNQKVNPVKGDYEVLAYYGDQPQVITHESFSVDFNSILALAWGYHYTKDIKYKNKAKELINSWVSNLGKPKDGGKTFLEWIRARWEADTPIVTECQFPKLMFSCWLLGLTDNNMKEWFKPYVEYINNYYTSMNNNHRSFKALMLISYGSIFNDKQYLNLGLSSYEKSKKFILDNGHMPLELIRGKKAASYSLMNLEALISCELLLKQQGFSPDDLLKKTINNFKLFFDDSQSKWNDIDKSELNKPDNKNDWGWVFVASNTIDSTTPIKSYYGFDVPRAYNLLFPELLR